MAQPEVFKMIYQCNRLATFVNWAYGDEQPCSRFKLAEAGYFVPENEIDNSVACCFVCQKSLYFDPEDDPWLEHSSHSKHCPFVKLNKKEENQTVTEFFEIGVAAMKFFLTEKLGKDMRILKKELEENTENTQMLKSYDCTGL